MSASACVSHRRAFREGGFFRICSRKVVSCQKGRSPAAEQRVLIKPAFVKTGSGLAQQKDLSQRRHSAMRHVLLSAERASAAASRPDLI